MKNDRAAVICLKKIIGYCDDIDSICRKFNCDRNKFDEEIEFRYSCSMCIIQIGELVSRLDDSFTELHAGIPWRKIKGMRNIFAHNYDIVSNDILWGTVTKDIPSLKKDIASILQDCVPKAE